MSRYTLGDMLGRGGMATVYRCRDQQSEMDVAAKILHPHLAADETMVEAFFREAQLMQGLKSPAIVQIYDTTTIDERPAIIMEVLDGGDLRRQLAQQGRLTEDEALQVVIPLLKALDQVHDHGIIHRDIKPDNILFDEHDRPRLIDFGIGQADELIELSMAGQVGTVAYMAPERIDGLAIDGRSDLYSVGVLLFELVTGQVPYQADSPSAVMRSHRDADVPDPGLFAPTLSTPVRQAIERAMAKHPEERFDDAQAFVDMLGGRGSDEQQEVGHHPRWQALVEEEERARDMAAPVEDQGHEWVVFIAEPDAAFEHFGEEKYAAIRRFALDHSAHLQLSISQIQHSADDDYRWGQLMRQYGIARGLSRQGVDEVMNMLDDAEIPARYARRSRTKRCEDRWMQVLGGPRVRQVLSASIMMALIAFFLVARAGYAGSVPVWLDPAFIGFAVVLGLSVGSMGAPAMAREFWYCRFSRSFLLDFCLSDRVDSGQAVIDKSHLRLARSLRSDRIRASFVRALNLSMHLLDFLEDRQLDGADQIEAVIAHLVDVAKELVDIETEITHLRPGELISQIRSLERRIAVDDDLRIVEAAMDEKLALREQLRARDRAQQRLQSRAQHLLSTAADLEDLLRRCRSGHDVVFGEFSSLEEQGDIRLSGLLDAVAEEPVGQNIVATHRDA